MWPSMYGPFAKASVSNEKCRTAIAKSSPLELAQLTAGAISFESMAQLHVPFSNCPATDLARHLHLFEYMDIDG